MEQARLENIYNEIMLLSDSDRLKLYSRMKKELHENTDIVAYTTYGEPLTLEKYKKEVQAGIEQCMRGESSSLEDLCNELGYQYADL